MEQKSTPIQQYNTTTKVSIPVDTQKSNFIFNLFKYKKIV